MKEEIDFRHGILSYFLKWEESTPDNIFLRQPEGNNWKEYTWREAGLKARKVVAAIHQMNYPRGTKIGIWSGNCAEWIIVDLAIMMGGYVSVPLYANVNDESLKGILLHSDCSLLFVGKLEDKYWDKNKEAIPPSVKTIAMDGYPIESITPWHEFIGSSDAMPDIILPSLDDLVTIIYTSGTTGAPKGVMHTYGTTIHALMAAIEMVKLQQPGNRFLSYLPLSHAAERGLVEFGAIYSGGSISFVESVDSFSDNIREVMPTHFLGVPRVWQKFRERILEKISQKRIDLLLSIPLISGFFKQKIRASLGLQKARVIVSGAAPITTDLLMWFHRLGVPIQEAYGLSEDFNVFSMNPKEDIRIGTVGKLFPNQEIKILPETNEIIQHSDWIMKGYYKDPELTARTLQDGYLHTGDMGEIVDGYLIITGRVKDIFKTAKGEYIAPFPIESYFLSLEEIDQACVLGSHYPQPFIVVVLSKSGKELSDVVLEKQLKSALNQSNQNSMGYQKLKKIVIVKEEWTVENSLLTLTLKMKRNVISKFYEEKLEKIYNTEETVSRE